MADTFLEVWVGVSKYFTLETEKIFWKSLQKVYILIRHHDPLVLKTRLLIEPIRTKASGKEITVMVIRTTLHRTGSLLGPAGARSSGPLGRAQRGPYVVESIMETAWSSRGHCWTSEMPLPLL